MESVAGVSLRLVATTARRTIPPVQRSAAVANQVLNTQLRAIEVERRIREQDELEGRLDELEELLEEAERSTSYARR
jgi:hypothetical protein